MSVVSWQKAFTAALKEAELEEHRKRKSSRDKEDVEHTETQSQLSTTSARECIKPAPRVERHPSPPPRRCCSIFYRPFGIGKRNEKENDHRQESVTPPRSPVTSPLVSPLREPLKKEEAEYPADVDEPQLGKDRLSRTSAS